MRFPPLPTGIVVMVLPLFRPAPEAGASVTPVP